MDSLDGRAVFEDLGRRIHAALRGEDEGWACLRAVPRIDGSLYLDLELDGRPFRVDWLPWPDPKAQAGSPRLAWSGGRIPAGPAAERTLIRVDAVLAEPGSVLLGLFNQELDRLTFDDQVVDKLLAGRFGPGQTRWFGYCFQDAFQPDPEAFQLTFDGPRGPVVFEVRASRADPRSDSLIANQVFGLLLITDPRTDRERGLLSHQLERFLGFLLNRAIHPGLRLEAPLANPDHPDGPDEAGPDGRPGRAGGEFEGAPVSTTRWGNPLQWHQFFSDFEIERAGLCSLKFTDPIAFVVHGEMECMSVEPRTFTPLVGFANLPWPDQPIQAEQPQRGFFTGLVEADVIRGGTSKLERALDLAISEPHVRLVCLNNTCLPKIIGDDVASAVRRARAKSEIPILSMNTDLDSPDAVYRDLLDQARTTLARVGAKAGQVDLALVGHPPGPGRRELISQLGAAGVQTTCCLLPEFGVEAMAAFLSARAGLVYPHGPWLDLAEQLLSDLGVALEPAPGPYGFEATRRWVRLASQALGDEAIYERWRARAYEPLLVRWQAQQREAAGHRLAAVVDRDSLGRLVEPRALYGFTLLPLLEQMGFGLDVLILGTPDQIDPAALAGALQDPDRLELHWFESPDELSCLLREGEFGAVYSEVFFDQRISRAGKAQFYLGMIGMGLAGALSGLRDLIDLCRWPFYRRYGSHLTKPRER